MPTRKAISYTVNSNGKEVEQAVHKHPTSCSSGWKRAVWWTKPQSWLLNIYFRLSEFQSSLLLRIHFHYSPWYLFTLHRKGGTEPIRYVTLQFRDLRDAASLRRRIRAKIAILVREQKPFSVWFSSRRETYSIKFEHSLTN